MTSVLHVHVVGDAKAGKSLAVKWMIHMLEARNRKTIEMREATDKQRNAHHSMSEDEDEDAAWQYLRSPYHYCHCFE